MNDTVEDYKKYLSGLEYNQSLLINGRGYYETIDAVIAMIGGDQWRNSKETDLPKPVFNILEPIEAFKVANIASTDIKVKFEPVEYREDGSMDNEIVASEILTTEVNAVLDEFGLEHKQRDLLADGFETGDYAVHVIYDAQAKLFEGKKGDYKGKIKIEIVDGQNVMYGNPNCTDIEKQPYVLVVGRDLVSNLQSEMKAFKKQNGTVQEDLEYTYMAGDNGKKELKGDKYGKALYIVMYQRLKDGTIGVSKFTETTYIYKDVKMGLLYYPVALGNWKKNKNCYHGVGGASGVIPNQIAINKLFASYIYHTQLTAFPTLIFDSKAIGGAWTSQIGVPVALNLEQGQRLEDAAQYLSTGAIATSISSIIDLIKTYTMELMGANDAALGNVNPDNTSAILAVQKATSVPLENVRARMYEFIKNLARIIENMITTNYGVRPIVVEEDGNKQIVNYDFGILKTFCLNSKLDVGPSGYYSDIATNTTLNNLLQGQYITMLQFLERIDDSLVPDRQKLIDELKGAMEGATTEQYEQMMAFFNTLDPQTQAQLQSLPDSQFEAAIMELMGQGQPQQGMPQ